MGEYDFPPHDTFGFTLKGKNLIILLHHIRYTLINMLPTFGLKCKFAEVSSL